VVVAAGDIACDPTGAGYRNGVGSPKNCDQRATSDLALAQHPQAVLLLGDNQYENATLAKYQASFDPTWGRMKAIIHPAAGNHEYLTPDATDYFDYFGAAAGQRPGGYYSWDLGGWHFVVINSNCTKAIGGCSRSSPQYQWLVADLAAHKSRCTLAYWHHPRFSSGVHGDETATDRFWRALYDAGADVVLVGHDHDYERFSPQTPDASADPARGIAEFVVGTGGKSHDPIRRSIATAWFTTPTPTGSCDSRCMRRATTGSSSPSDRVRSPTPGTAPATDDPPISPTTSKHPEPSTAVDGRAPQAWVTQVQARSKGRPNPEAHAAPSREPE